MRSTLSDLPTRAEFIRDRLSEWLDAYGYATEAADAESEFEHPTLFASSAMADVRLYVTLDCLNDRARINGELRDADTDEPLWFSGFAWVAEPTDTGAMHGPWLTGARVTTHNGVGEVLPLDNAQYGIVRVRLERSAATHPGYCYASRDVRLARDPGAAETLGACEDCGRSVGYNGHPYIACGASATMPGTARRCRLCGRTEVVSVDGLRWTSADVATRDVGPHVCHWTVVDAAQAV